MKRYLFILVILALGFSSQAQVTIKTFSQGTGNYFDYVGLAADTVGTANIDIYKRVDISSAIAPVYFNFYVKIAKVSGNIAGHKVIIRGSNGGNLYTTLMSKTLGDASDSAYFTRCDSVGYVYKYIDVLLDSDGSGVSKIANIDGKIVTKFR
jgi:hypothetical protein